MATEGSLDSNANSSTSLPHFVTISFTPLCHSISEDTLKAVGPYYLLSMPGEVKHSTQGVNVQPVVDSTTLDYKPFLR